MRVLVSGFGPFLSEKVNPTQEIAHFVNSCDSHTRSGWGALDVRGVVLPVEFDGAFARLEQERALFKPDVILSFGLAGGREHFEIEQVAVNVRGTGVIDSSAPLALPTTLPSDMLLAGLRAAGIPARFSYSAGTYVCNDLFFQMQNRLRFTRVRSGFIHVPRLISSDTAEPMSPSVPLSAAWPWERFELAVHTILSALAGES